MEVQVLADFVQSSAKGMVKVITRTYGMKVMTRCFCHSCRAESEALFEEGATAKVNDRNADVHNLARSTLRIDVPSGVCRRSLLH